MRAAEAVSTAEAKESAATAANESAAAETTVEVNAMTTPIFKPFVMVRLPVPEGYTGGLVTDVNDNGLAVGWIDDTGSSTRRPFVFDNVANEMHILSLPSGCTWGEALALNNGTSTLRVVGYVRIEYQSALYDRPIQWDVDLSDWSDTRSYGGATNYDGYMTAVNDAGSVGAHEYNVTPGNTPSVWRKVGNTIYSSLWVDPQISGRMNADHAMVGRWWTDGGADNGHAFLWVHEENVATIDPEDWDYSGASDINDNFDIVGWVGESESTKVPALWEHDGEGWLTLNPFPAIGVSAVAVALNNEREMVIARDDTIPGAAVWKRVGTTDHGIELRQIVLIPGTGDDETEYLVQTATSINDNMWIGGSYVEHQTVSPFAYGEPRPCLMIPYDVDNDGTPDFREILEGDEADNDGNWLIDHGEAMRVGLHAPGSDSVVEANTSNAQIVRHMLHLYHTNFDEENLEEIPLNGILENPDSCHVFTTNLNLWTRGTQQREAIITLRSTFNAAGEDREFDWLPPSNLRQTNLENIREFAYKYATCLDWMQIGNESFTGSGQYKYRGDDLDGQGCTGWTEPKTLSQLPSQACREEAIGLVLLWMEEQAQAVLEGSALAGRPLRIIGPAITGAHTQTAYAQSGEGRTLLEDVIGFADRNQMYFSQHVHYISANDGAAIVGKLTGTGGYSQVWAPPHWMVATEWGPMVDPNGDFDTQENRATFDLFMMQTGCSVDPGKTWEQFVNDWESAQFDNDPDFGLGDVLGGMAAVAFNGVCYGPTIGHTDPWFEFDMAVIRATTVCSQYIQTQGKFTEFRTHYQDAANGHQIASFTPHQSECPVCPQQ